MEDLAEDAFEVALDARSFVFLESIITLSRPFAQLQIESEDLENQWKRLQRGIREIDPGSDIYFLDSHDALEYGLETDFVTRCNLATFAHEAFSETLDLDRCKRSLHGFSVIFPLEAENSDNTLEDRLPVFLQLVAIILVLYSKSSQSPARQKIMESCNSNQIPELSQLSKMNITPVIELAVKVSKSDKQLAALYNDTLKQIIKLVDQKLQLLKPIVAVDFAEDLRETRDQEMGQLYTEHSISSIDDYDNVSWINIPISEYQSAVKEHHATSKGSSSSKSDVVANTDDHILSDHISDDVMDLDESHVDQEIDIEASERSESPARYNKKRAIGTNLDQNNEYLPKTRRKRSVQISDQDDAFITDPEDAGSISINIPKRLPRPSTGGSQSARNVSQPTRNESGSARKPTVHWTDKEIDRLLGLVDQYMYDESEIITKKRTVKWSRLKAYDKAHGNILGGRTQVQLKDKYRQILGRKPNVASNWAFRTA